MNTNLSDVVIRSKVLLFFVFRFINTMLCVAISLESPLVFRFHHFIERGTLLRLNQ